MACEGTTREMQDVDCAFSKDPYVSWALLQGSTILQSMWVSNNHHVAGKDMCVGFFVYPCLTRKKKQA